MSKKRKREQVQPELEILENGQSFDASYDKCTKKAGHGQYILAKDFKMSHLPIGFQHQQVFEFVSVVIKLTGMLTYFLENGSSAFGTVLVQKVNKVPSMPCPCPECGSKQTRPWAYVEVSTTLHVFTHRKYVESCKVHLFFDNHDTDGGSDNEKIVYGKELHSVDEDGDWCAVLCVTHDVDLIENLEKWTRQFYELGGYLEKTYKSSVHNTNLALIVSHPHSGPKCVSIGKVVDRTVERDVRDGQDWCSYSYTTMTCNGSSGAFVYVLGMWREGYGYWFGHPQNHRGMIQEWDKFYGCSSIGVDTKCQQPKL